MSIHSLVPQLSLQADWAREKELASSLIATLKAAKKAKKKKGAIRCATQKDEQSGFDICSWNFSEFLFKKKGALPTAARGLFTTESGGRSSNPDGRSRIVLRGYDKFFNVGEVESWDKIGTHTRGPYEVTVKENGCIIFVSSTSESHVVITSKHSLKSQHALKGREWLVWHLNKARKTEADLAHILHECRLTAVFELADDEFEEHILAYTGEDRGLYLHGLNYNTANLRTVEHTAVQKFGDEFGFHNVDVVVKRTLKEVIEFTDEVRDAQVWKGRPIEGFVVRCHSSNPTTFAGNGDGPTSDGAIEALDGSMDSNGALGRENRATKSDNNSEDMTSRESLVTEEPTLNFMFKVKYDDPYLMFREFREVTKPLICNNGKPHYTFKIKYPLTHNYIKWVKRKWREDRFYFDGYLHNHGIIKARVDFMNEWELRGGKDISDEEGEEEIPSPDDKILLVPIATIGVGKTTLAKTLVKLLSIGHIQNDDISMKSENKAKEFASLILEEFESGQRIVFADRNNHRHSHREGLANELRRAVRDKFGVGTQVFICALEWQWDQDRTDELIARSVKRVNIRGENHQTLVPSETTNIEKIIRSFTTKRDDLDRSHPADSEINRIIALDAFADTADNVATVLSELEHMVDIQHFEPEVIVASVKEAMAERVNDLNLQHSGPHENRKDDGQTAAKDGEDGWVAVKKGKSGSAKDMKKPAIKEPLYYGLQVQHDILSLLEKVIATESCATAQKAKVPTRKVGVEVIPESTVPTTLHQALELLKHRARIVAGSGHHHVTLVFLGGSTTKKGRNSVEQRRVNVLANEYSARVGEAVTIHFSKILWNHEVMTIPVSLPEDIPCINKYAHITVGTFSDEIKPVVAGPFLVNVFDTENDYYFEHTLEEEMALQTSVCSYYGR